MNNLLRTLTESRAKPPGDLKLLLTAVKETRGNDSKADKFDTKQSEIFHESLDNLLADLRTITVDNRDAEAFLKPVSRQEVPDYYDYITNPMDFLTIGRKLKTKSYKSKREFKDDLDLIWSNCYKYNAAEDHPLRQCADRLKAKAERLLKYITDRKDRVEPPIPFDIAQPGIARPRLTNGISTAMHKRTTSSIPQAPTPPPQPVASTSARKLDSIPFADSPALLRTQEGMSLFRDIDRGLLADSQSALNKLKDLVPFSENDDSEPDSDQALTGDKRKLNGTDGRPRKRARFALPDDLAHTQLWWSAVQTDSLLANGLPEIPYAASRRPRVKKRKRKEVAVKKEEGITEEGGPTKSMLGLLNSNIKAMRRVRTDACEDLGVGGFD
ncbi:Bromodomain-containing protein [Coprinellus micaceus]|uniref:Bromodomain-containing protein n=1 Tax=Coprinellus micaceus TaxID=71717 RepID=A0A4Y7TUP5_COPMI|nr:Bromodomain-containing protein [Coprinellus micaceus]